MRLALFLTALFFASALLAAPEVPGPPQDHPIAIVGATIHPVNGPVIEGGEIVFEGGKIVALGKGMTLAEFVERIDATGKHVYPGLIDSLTDMGLIEIESVRATLDQAETGRINPNARAQAAFNPDSELIPVARAGGVLTVLTVPQGGLISGTSAAMRLDGWTWEEMTVAAPVALHVNWPAMSSGRMPRDEDAQTQAREGRERALRELDQAFADARAYLVAKRAAETPGSAIPMPDHDLRWEAMIPVLEGRVPVAVHADEVRQLQAAAAFAEREKIKLLIVGGYDALLAADVLKRAGASVVVSAVHRLPQRPGDPYDAAFTLPERLRQAGIPFCIAGGGQASQVRNLGHHAATAAGYGLPSEEALKAVTLYPAQILGVADRLGSLEPGKEATLIVTNGDPLEIATQIEGAFIEGRRVDLSNRHKSLWEKYKERYRRLGIQNP